MFGDIAIVVSLLAGLIALNMKIRQNSYEDGGFYNGRDFN